MTIPAITETDASKKVRQVLQNVDKTVTDNKTETDASIAAKKFGAWDHTTYSAGNNYQAATDGFVVFNCGPSSSTVDIAGFTDNTTTPAKQVAGAYASHSGAPKEATLTFPVKKDDYWKVEITTGVTINLGWMPIG